MTVEPQYQFVDGHWRDAWNGNDDTEPFPDFMGNGDTWASEVLRGRAGWCGCADLDWIISAMRRYLRGEWGAGDNIVLYSDADAMQILVALTADAAGFTEHGGNICASWLTDAGRRWLELASTACDGCGCPPERCAEARVKCCPDCTHAVVA